MKEVMRAKGYLRYCDDTVGLAATKAEARSQMQSFSDLSEQLGLVVKSNAILSRIGKEIKNEKGRKRKRSKKR